MFHLPTNIKIDWQDNHKNLDYVYEDFKDFNKINQWKNCGFDLKQLKIGLHQLKEPYAWMKCVTDVVDSLSIKNPTYCIHCLTPGNFLPMHSDLYGYYANKNSINDLTKIIRIIVFLDNAEPGQLLIVNNVSYINYKKGDIAWWTGKTPHLAANLSEINRYTLQITGTIEID